MKLAKNSDKVYAFEFLVRELLKWYNSNSTLGYNDFSTLKILKLLFFVSAANANQNFHSILLEDLFNRFHAMPYGHVESDIYDTLKSELGKLNYFEVGPKSTVVIPGTDQNELTYKIPENTQKEIFASLHSLYQANPNIVFWTAFDLVDLSHAWHSWQFYYAKSSNRSALIPPDLIKSESKIFNLQSII
jgi:hypothetical protein